MFDLIKQHIEMTSVGVFIRVSTEETAKGDSPEVHLERAKYYAKSKDWEIVEVYDLSGVSGKTTEHHPETQRMLNDVKTGHIDGLIFSHLSRLARNTTELLRYADIFKLYDASLISLSESIDTSTSSGRFFYTILASLAAFERENMVERMLAANETRRNQGKWVAGQASFGFAVVDGKHVINEKEASIRKLMYDLYIEHRRIKRVATILNERGYRTRKGSKWTGITVSRLLKNSDAKGIRMSNYRRTPTKTNPSIYKPESEWVFTPCESIISEELWDQVNYIIETQAKSREKNAIPRNLRTNIFTGLIKCSEGHKMSLTSKTKKYTCAKCSLRIDMDDLEEIFLTRLKQIPVDQKDIEKVRASTEKTIESRRLELTNAEKKLKDIDTKMERLITLNIEGQIPNQSFKGHYDPLLHQKDQLKEHIIIVKNQISATSNSNIESIMERAKKLYANWPSLTRPEKREIALALVENITFDGSELSFNLRRIAPLSFKEIGTEGAPHLTASLPGGRPQT